jgi:hypothetical protein
MKKIIIITMCVASGCFTIKALLTTGVEELTELKPPSQQELMQFAEPTTCQIPK